MPGIWQARIWRPRIPPIQHQMTPSRRGRCVRVRRATHCTRLSEIASSSSTPGSGPEGLAHEMRAKHAIHGSTGAAHCAKLIAARDCRRWLPARPACRAAPTPPAGASDQASGPPRDSTFPPPGPASRERLSRESRHNAILVSGLAQGRQREVLEQTCDELCCADRPCEDGERQEMIGGADQLGRTTLHQRR